jgi:predicted Zn-ribbon and HTH transcriptional regulator
MEARPRVAAQCVSEAAVTMAPVNIEPTEAVREVLEQENEPLSTEEVTAALQSALSADEVQEALEYWHREIGAVEDAAGKWLWVGPRQ